MEPEAIADGEGGRLAREDEVPAWRDIFDASKLSGGGEREEVDAAKDAGW